jgi:glycosyltransferase involved in cell wall biosynthesis
MSMVDSQVSGASGEPPDLNTDVLSLQAALAERDRALEQLRQDLLMLINEVMRRIWCELPELTCTIVGAGSPAEVTALASPRVAVRGWVDDLSPVLDGARALLAPVRFGAGVKGTITQALAEGLPVVTTPIGAEGLEATDGVDLLIGRDLDELAARTVQLVRDDALWERLSRAGQRLIGASGSPAVIVDRLQELLSLQPKPARLHI